MTDNKTSIVEFRPNLFNSSRIVLAAVYLALSTFEALPQSSEPSTALKLASLDAGRILSPEDKIIQSYDEALKYLSKRFKLPEKIIADKSRAASKNLQERGLETTALDLMQVIMKLNPKTSDGTGYDSLLAAVATVILDGSANR